MKHVLLFFLIAFSSQAQILNRQSVSSSQGKTMVTSKGFGVSQTIGQQSVAGTASASGYVVQQGFQQSLRALNTATAAKATATVVTNVFPNPFVSEINFDLGSEIKDEVEIILYDGQGRTLHSSKQTPTNNRLTLSALGGLSEGNYFVSLFNKNFKYTTQIIKLN